MPLVFAALPPGEAKAFSGIVISEVAWAGSSLSQADEWIELFNPNDVDVSVGGWTLTGAGSSGKQLVFPAEETIAAHATYVVANYDSGNSKSALNIEPDLVTSTLSLSNSSMFIELIDAEGDVIDVAGNGNTPLAGSSGEVKVSMQRINLLLDGDQEAAWSDAEASVNLTTSDLGSPGETVLINQTLVDETEESLEVGGQEVETSEECGAAAATSSDVGTNPVGQATSTDAAYATSTVSTTTSTQSVATTTSSIPETSVDLDSTTSTATTSTSSTTSSTTSDIRSSDLPTLSTINHYKSLRLNEVMAAPKTGKEWVEIYNSSVDWTIDLEGIELHDAVGKVMTLEGEMEPLTYKVFYIPSSRLNNGGDSVKLYAPESRDLLDTLNYLAMKKGVPYARDLHSNWQETLKATPGSENIIEQEATISEDVEVSTESNTKEKDIEQASTEEVKNDTDNEKVGTTSIKACLPMLSEFVPAPDQGKEWIEIACSSTQSVSAEARYELYDSAGKIGAFEQKDFVDEFLVIELGSARLNNGGDAVKLLGDNGEVLDQFAYEESEKGFSWTKQDDGGWILTEQVSKGEQNFELTVEDLEKSSESRMSTVKMRLLKKQKNRVKQMLI